MPKQCILELAVSAALKRFPEPPKKQASTVCQTSGKTPAVDVQHEYVLRAQLA